MESEVFPRQSPVLNKLQALHTQLVPLSKEVVHPVALQRATEFSDAVNN